MTTLTEPELVDAVSTPVDDAAEETTSTEIERADDAVPEQIEQLADALHEYVETPSWKEMQGLAAMAVTLSAAHAVPEALRQRPNDVFLVLLTARELGIAPTTALRTAYVVNGAVTLAPKLRAAMVRQRKLGKLWPDTENDRESATWHATRADEQHERVYSFTFTMDDARGVPDKNATLADKNNWKAYPQRMLSWRALGYLLDDVFPEVGTGIYSPDELGAVTDEEGTPVIDIASTDPLPGTKAPRGHKPPLEEAQPPANPDELAQLRAVIEDLPDDARGELLDLWTKPRDGAGNLPPLAKLEQRHMARARAMVESISKRVDKGEWGGWPNKYAGTPEASESPEGSVDTSDAPESPESTNTGVYQDPESYDENVIEETQRLAEEVKSMPKAQVIADLAARGLPTSGGEQVQRLRLAEAFVRDMQQARDGTPALPLADENPSA